MTKSQEQRMNELAESMGWRDDDLEACFCDGYQAAMEEAEVLVEALEFYRNRKSYYYKEFSDGIVDRGDFPVMDDQGAKAFTALKKFKGE